MRSKSLWAIAIAGVLVMTLTAVYASHQDVVIEVRLGEKGEKGDTRDDDEHNISIKALREGTTKFFVKGKKDTMFLVDLAVEPEQIKSFAQGTALVVDAMPAVKAEGDNDNEDAVDGWVVQAGVDASMVVTLQLKQKTADAEFKPGSLMPPGGSAGGGW